MERARELWSQAFALDPLNAYVCHALSNLEKRLRNFDRAREVLQAVVKQKPTAAICVSLAELERQLGSPEKARECSSSCAPCVMQDMELEKLAACLVLNLQINLWSCGGGRTARLVFWRLE